MKRLLMLLALLVATPAWATTLSYYHIPGSAFRSAVPAATCKGTCTLPQGACSPNPVGADHKATWACAATGSYDPGIETDLFSLPPFATTTTMTIRVVWSDSGSTASDVGFYGYFEVTPTSGFAADVWADNTGQDCAPSATAEVVPIHNDVDNATTIVVRTCNQTTAVFCSADAAGVTTCAGSTGYHGVLVIRRDNTSFAPNLAYPVNVSEVIVGVTTP